MNIKTEKPVANQAEGEVFVANSADNSPKAEEVIKEEVVKKEINGPKGLEPTRYGDWESKGRCYDF